LGTLLVSSRPRKLRSIDALVALDPGRTGFDRRRSGDAGRYEIKNITPPQNILATAMTVIQPKGGPPRPPAVPAR
jgi:hypothetical protein